MHRKARYAAMLAAIMMIAAALGACGGGPPPPIAGAAAAAQQEEARRIIQEVEAREEEAEVPAQEAEPRGGANSEGAERDQGWTRWETITVPGTGTAEKEPDFIRLSLGAVSHGKDPLTILEEVSLAMTAMTSEAERLGIEPADIRTAAFQIHEKYKYEPGSYEQQRDGFTAIQTAAVTIRDMERAGMIVGRLIDAVGSAGTADLSLQGVAGRIDDPEGLRIRALEEATMNLWDQARTVAAESGRQVCRLLEVQAGGAGQHHGQGGINFDRPVISAASAGASLESSRSAYGGVSISPGRVRETAWVTGVFLMTPTGEEPGEGCGGP